MNVQEGSDERQRLLDEYTTEEYRTYRQRFLVLATAGVFCFSSSLSWFTFAGFPLGLTSSYFGIEAWLVNLTLAFGPIMFLLLSPLYAFLLDRLGIRTCMLIASCCLLVCSLLRALCFAVLGGAGILTPSQAHSVWPAIIVAQLIGCAAGPVSMSVPVKLSALWFPPSERPIATAITVTAGPLGSAAGYLLGLTVHYPVDLGVQMNVQLGLMMFVSIAVLCFIADEPPTPSSAATDRKTNNSHITAAASSSSSSVFLSIVHLFTSAPNILLLLLAAGLSQGVLYAWTTLIALMFQPLGFSVTQTGWLGFAISIAGVCGGLTFSTLSSLRIFKRRYKWFIVVDFLVAGLVFCFFTMLTADILPSSPVATAIMAILGSFLYSGANPLFYEMAAEMAYPTPEGVIGVLVAFSLNIFILIFVLLQDALSTAAINWLNAAVALVLGCSMTFIKETYSRQQQEQH